MNAPKTAEIKETITAILDTAWSANGNPQILARPAYPAPTAVKIVVTIDEIYLIDTFFIFLSPRSLILNICLNP